MDLSANDVNGMCEKGSINMFNLRRRGGTAQNPINIKLPLLHFHLGIVNKIMNTIDYDVAV